MSTVERLILLHELGAIAFWSFCAVIAYDSEDGYSFVPVTVAALLWELVIPMAVALEATEYYRTNRQKPKGEEGF